MVKKSYSLLLSGLLLITVQALFSATYYSRVSGNWNTATTWSTIGCGGVAASSVPTAADNVIICSGRTVTMNGNPASCLSLTVNGTANWTSTFTINVGTGGVTLNNNALLTGSATGIMNVSGPFTVPAGASANISRLTLIVSGTTTVNGTLVFSNTNGTKTFSNVNVTGGTINCTANETLTITGNLSLTAGSITATTGIVETITVGGTFNIGTGTSTFDAGNLTVTGLTTITGTINWIDRDGTKSLNDVTISSGGVFNNSVGEDFTINGNIHCDGTVNGGIRTFTLTGTNKVLSGTGTINLARAAISGSYTNNTTLNINTRISGSGSLTQGSTGVLNFSGTLISIAQLNASAAGNTVNYSMTSNFTIPTPDDGSYANLTVTNAIKSINAALLVTGNLTIPASTTFNCGGRNVTLLGNLVNNGTFDTGGGSQLVTMSGTTAQSISGSATTAFDALTISNTSFPLSVLGNISAKGIINVNTGAILEPAAAAVISGIGSITGTGTIKVTRTAATPDFFTQYSITTKVLTGLIVDYIGAGNQNVNIADYSTLVISSNGTRTVTFPAGLVGVSVAFLPSLVNTSYVVTGNTVIFNGTASENIPAFNYNNLSSSSTGGRVLSSTGIIGVAGTFTPSTNVYTITGSTVDYNGSASQTVTAFNYNNLTSSSTGLRTLASLGTIGVAAVFTPGSNNYTVTGSTINFNGTIAQSVPAFTFNNIILSGSNSKQLAGNIIVQNDITITSNLDVSASNFTINIRRNWINNGVFTAQLGTVTFDGATAQTLSGTSSTTFENLAISNTSGGVSLISGTYQLAGALLMNSGTFSSNGSFTMLSTASKTARIGQVAPGASITGNFTIQRFLDSHLQSSSVSHWSDLAAPVQATTMADWDNELYLSYPHTPPTVYSNVVAFDESIDDYVGVSAGTTLTPGQGFEIALTDDQTLSGFSATTLTSVGVPDQGTQNLSSLISFTTSGSNLVGNPFASSIAWSTVLSNSSGIMSTYDVFDTDAGSYSSFGAGTEIAAGQGFWVYTTSSSASLIIPEAAKTTSSNSTVRSNIENNYMTVQLKNSDPANSFSHTLKIAAAADASDGWDLKDHPFKKSPCAQAPAITAFADSKEVSIFTFNSLNSKHDILLNTKAGSSGEHDLTIAGTQLMKEYVCIALEDKENGTLTDMSNGGTYRFTATKTTTENRFVLHFSKEGNCFEQSSAAMGNSPEILPSSRGNIVRFSFAEAQPVQIDVVNVLGQAITESINLSAVDQSTEIVLPDGFKGCYLINIHFGGRTFSRKFVK